MANENMHSEEVYATGLPLLYIPIPMRTVIQECDIRRRVPIPVRAIACPELRMDLNLTSCYLHTTQSDVLVSLSSQITKQNHSVSEGFRDIISANKNSSLVRYYVLSLGKKSRKYCLHVDGQTLLSRGCNIA